MAIQNTSYLDVDIKRDNYVDEPKVTQNDAVTFVLRMTDDGVDYPLVGVSTYTLASLRPDGQSVLTVGTLTAPNEITFELGSTEVSVPGNVKAAIQLYDVDGRVSSMPFTYEVTKDIAVDYIPSAEEETLIQLVLGEGPAILNAAELVTAEANEFLTNNVRIGEYDNAVTYEKGNEVGYDGSSYVALGSTHGNLPTDTAFWTLRARKGEGDVNSVNGVLPDGNGDVTIAIPDPDLSGLATKTELQTLSDITTDHINTLKGVGLFVEDYPRIDGENDDTERLNRLITDAPNGATIVINKSLDISKNITVSKTLKFKSDNNSTLFFTSNFNDESTDILSMFTVDVQDVLFENISFDGANTSNMGLSNRFIWFNPWINNGKVINCTFTNLPSGGTNFNGAIGYSGQANDGVVQSCLFENCPGAAFSQASRTIITDCISRAPKDVSFAINSSNSIGSSITNCKVYANDLPCSIHIGVEEGARDFIISNNYIYGVKDGIGIGCINVGVFTESHGGIISNNVVDGGSFTSTSPSALLKVSKYYKDILITGNIFKNSPRGNGNNSAVSLSLNDQKFVNNKVITGSGASGFCIFIAEVNNGDLIIKDNEIDASGLSRVVYVSSGDYLARKIISKDNVYKNATEGLYYTLPSNLKVYIEGDTYESITSPINGGVRWQDYFNAYRTFNYPYKINSRVVLYGSSVPTDGSWEHGDKVYNYAPSAGGFEGWVCVIPGIPGIWKGFGAIQS